MQANVVNFSILIPQNGVIFKQESWSDQLGWNMTMADLARQSGGGGGGGGGGGVPGRLCEHALNKPPFHTKSKMIKYLLVSALKRNNVLCMRTS